MILLPAPGRASTATLFVLLIGVSLVSCGTPASPAETLRYAAQRTERAGSARISGTTTWYPEHPEAEGQLHGTLSWSPVPTAEFVMPLGANETVFPDQVEVARFTSDAEYLSPSSRMRDGLGGKPWGRRPFRVIAGQPARPAVELAFPATFAALLSTGRDVRLLGSERIGGRLSRHYAGTVDPAHLAADPAIGLTEHIVADWRANFPDAGQHLDVWIDPDGYPVRVEARRLRPFPAGSFSLEVSHEPDIYVPVIVSEPLIRLEYSDYGEPPPLVAPPPDQVHQLHAH
jgi:hypothetical protein